MDRLLREAMAAGEPRLSPAFDARLARRLRPRRLSSTGRLVMTVYTVAALVVSVWTMRSASLDWSVVAAAVLVPLAVVAIVHRRRFTTAS
jgi:hypothetical protein